MVLKNERVSEQQHMLKDASHGTFKLAILNWRWSDSTCPLQKKKNPCLATNHGDDAKEYECKLCQPKNDDELKTMIDFCWFVN